MNDRVVASMPPIIAGTPIGSPLLPGRVARGLLDAGWETLGDLAGVAVEELMVDGAGVKGIITTMRVLETLCALPADRLSRLSWAVEPGDATLPRLPVEVLAALSYVQSVDEEAAALVADLEPRKRAMVFARWGVGGQPRLLDDIGRSFGITRERARQIIQVTEHRVMLSGLRLPLASAAVQDLDWVGGALPPDTYEVLMRYSPTAISPGAIRLLPLLHQLRCVPEISFDNDALLWLTAAGRTRWVESGEASRLVQSARRTANEQLRRIGAVPHSVAEGMSPFGREHALQLVGGRSASFIDVAQHAVRIPPQDSALLRVCRKTLVVTGPLGLDELTHALQRGGFAQLPTELLRASLQSATDFAVDGDAVAVTADVRSVDVLAPAEAAAFGMLDSAGGAMLWIDFVDGMVARGYSAAMANFILRKPAVRHLGPALYGLRGRTIAPDTLHGLRRKRGARLRGGGPVVQVRQIDGTVVVDYVLNRFAMQGVLPAPAALKGVRPIWTAWFSDTAHRRIKIANNFIWPLRSWFTDQGLVPGDRLRVTFQLDECVARFHVVKRFEPVPGTRLRTRDEQITRALFGEHI